MPTEDDIPQTSPAPMTYQNEVDFYTHLENLSIPNSHKYFLKFHGCFVMQGKGFVILECADQGSLQDFFKQNNFPYDHEELHGLWRNLADLFLGLSIIHNCDGNDDQGGTIRAVHQDFKPANIFVFREGRERLIPIDSKSATLA